MKHLIIFLSVLISLLHFYFMILEMFLWTKPKGLKTFGMTKELAEASKTLAANQGLYNGFLGGGILLALISSNQLLLHYLLFCVILAGIYGAYSTKIFRIFLIQSLPAILTLVLSYYDH